MAVCSSVCVFGFTVATLLLLTICPSAEAVSAKTVEVDEIQCGKVFTMGNDVDTYRVIMPEGGMCQPWNGSFECSIRFSSKRVSTLTKICVDYARMTLSGEATKVIIGPEKKYTYRDVVLTSTKYPLLNRYMSTVKCYPSLAVLNVTFIADCKTAPYALRTLFSSWLYVYTQPARDHMVFHIDGTCKHRKTITSYEKLTVRSFIWQDTADKARHHNCSLKLESFSSTSIGKKKSLCSKWKFRDTSCQVSAHLRKVVWEDKFDYSGSKNFTCKKALRHTGMDGCVPIDILDSPLFEVRRDADLTEDLNKIPDGALFFETKASLKIEYEERKYEDIYTSTGSSDYESDINVFMQDNVTFKFLLPIAAIFGICACICGLHRKKSNSEDAECGATHAATDVGETAVSQPLVLPPGSVVHHPQAWGGGNGVHGEGHSMAVPPPTYDDVAHITPSADEEAHNFRSSAAETAPSAPELSSSSEIPPPPFTDDRPAAPPAYHDLFPSNS